MIEPETAVPCGGHRWERLQEAEALLGFYEQALQDEEAFRRDIGDILSRYGKAMHQIAETVGLEPGYWGVPERVAMIFRLAALAYVHHTEGGCAQELAMALRHYGNEMKPA